MAAAKAVQDNSVQSSLPPSASSMTNPAEEMKRYLAALVTLILVVVLAMGCASSGEMTGRNYTTEMLQARLEQDGITLLARGAASQPFLNQTGQEFVTSRGGSLQIYEYESVAAAVSDREQISQFGLRLSGPAHVYHEGRLIAIFFGNDITVEQGLADVLGPQLSL